MRGGGVHGMAEYREDAPSHLLERAKAAEGYKCSGKVLTRSFAMNLNQAAYCVDAPEAKKHSETKQSKVKQSKAKRQ